MLVPGTYRLDYQSTPVVFDIPSRAQLMFRALRSATPDLALGPPRRGDLAIILESASQDAWLGLDVKWGGEWDRGSGGGDAAAALEQLFDWVVESMWRGSR